VAPDTRLHEVRTELANAVRAAADSAGVALRADRVVEALDEVQRHTEALRSPASPAAEAEIAALRRCWPR
jgi:hypothetical protein